MTEDRLDVGPAKAQARRDLTLVGATGGEGGNAIGVTLELGRQGRLLGVSAVRLPGVAEIPEARVKPVFAAALPQELEEPLLEAAR